MGGITDIVIGYVYSHMRTYWLDDPCLISTKHTHTRTHTHTLTHTIISNKYAKRRIALKFSQIPI